MSTATQSVMNMDRCLEELGVHDGLLSADERAHLDTQGYLVIPNVLSPDLVQQFSSRLDEIAAEEMQYGKGGEVGREEGTNLLGDLVNKDALFQVCYTTPKVLAAVSHVLRGEFRLSSLNSRSALPQKGSQAMHADFEGTVEPGDYKVCNSIWLVNDFTTENGPTRLVPGTHNSGKTPQMVMENDMLPHPDEIKLIAPAGTVAVFNAHTWHGGTLNTTSEPRRATHAYFCRRDYPQQSDQRKYLKPETNARLSSAMKFLLDVM